MTEWWESHDVTEWWELRVVTVRGPLELRTTLVYLTRDDAVAAATKQNGKTWTIVHCEAEAERE
jgi:hypothetical protein